MALESGTDDPDRDAAEAYVPSMVGTMTVDASGPRFGDTIRRLGKRVEHQRHPTDPRARQRAIAVILAEVAG